MSTVWTEHVDMNMTYLLPVLCIFYILLPRKVRTLPVTNTLTDINDMNEQSDENNTFYESFSDKFQENSVHFDYEIAKESGITLEDDYSDASSKGFPSSDKSQEDMDKRTKAKESVVPEYMMDLYKRLSRNSRYVLPESNIVRSFRNIDSEATQHNSDSHDNMKKGIKSHAKILVFNISSISRREIITLAELRIFTLIERDKTLYDLGVDKKVSFYDITSDGDPSITKYELISSHIVYGRLSDWETFNITSAVKKWVKDGKSIHKIEIRLENLWWAFSLGTMDFKTIPNDKEEPLLLVYSSDDSKHKEHIDERHELISHEISSHSISHSAKGRVIHERPSDIYSENASDRKLSRKKRSRQFRRSNLCRRRPMFVDFEDINWHTWIIAPRGYQAYQCVGKCFFPVSETLSPSKHAIIQSTLHSHNPKKAVRACCVPTELDPISILYIDEQGVITYKYHYDGMVVKECGCR